MKFLLLALLLLPFAADATTLSNFELTDQNVQRRSYQFPRKKVTVMTVADHKGSDQLGPWIQAIYDRYQTRIDIDGIADVSIIAKPFHNFFRSAFRKKLTRSVLLDWEGNVVKQFAYKKGIANLYVIGTDGRILCHLSGPVTPALQQQIFGEIDRAFAANGSPAR